MNTRDLAALAVSVQASAKLIETYQDDETLHGNGINPTDTWHQERLLKAEQEFIYLSGKLVLALMLQRDAPGALSQLVYEDFIILAHSAIRA